MKKFIVASVCAGVLALAGVTAVMAGAPTASAPKPLSAPAAEAPPAASVVPVPAKSESPASKPGDDVPRPETKKYATGESYAVPTFKELALTTLMLDGLDIDKKEVADEYAKVVYCELYKEKYKSDFEWNSVRQELIRKVQSKKEYFRTRYEVAGVVYLGRYSFETQDFPFIKDSALVNVGSLTVLSLDNNMVAASIRRLCDDSKASGIFPSSYVFDLNFPLTLDRLKIPMDEAEKLLAKMDTMNNKDRRLYVRFRVNVMTTRGIDRRRGLNSRAVLRGELTGIDFFYDQEMTKHFATVSVK